MKASVVIVGFLCIARLILVNVVAAEVESGCCAKSPLPKAKAGLGVAIVNETLYAIGGWSPMPTNTT